MRGLFNLFVRSICSFHILGRCQSNEGLENSEYRKVCDRTVLFYQRPGVSNHVESERKGVVPGRTICRSDMYCSLGLGSGLTWKLKKGSKKKTRRSVWRKGPRFGTFLGH